MQNITSGRLRGLTALGLAVTVAATAAPTAAFAAPGNPTPESCFTFDETTGTISYYSEDAPGCPADVTIPATIDGVAVTAIDEYTFYGDDLASITLTDTITSVGNYAFAGNNFVKVDLPDSITDLGTNILFGNPLLEEINFGTPGYTGPALWTLDGFDGWNDLQNTGNGKGGLQRVTFGPIVRAIAPGAFYAHGLEQVTIPGTVTDVGDLSFAAGTLTDVRLGAGVEYVGYGAFAQNDLANVYVEGNPELSDQVFGRNVSDETFIRVLGTGVTELEAFEYVRDNAKLVNVFAADADFVAAYGPGRLEDAEVDVYDGSPFEGFVGISGYIVNPAQLHATYVSEGTSTEIAPQSVITGAGATDYRVATAREVGIGAFYVAGEPANVIPQPIDGFTAPTPFVTPFVLALGSTDVTLSYQPAESGDSAPGGDDSGSEGSEGGEGDGAGAGSDGTGSGAAAAGPSGMDGADTSTDGKTVATGGFDAAPLTITAAVAMLLSGAVLTTLFMRRRHVSA
jgi:hypothetical protein